MIRILYLITGTGIGGTERSLLETCLRLDRTRYLPTVVSLKKTGTVGELLRQGGVDVRSLGMVESAGTIAALQFIVGLLRFPGIVGGERYDILHTFLFRAGIFGRLVARRCGIPRTVCSYRGTLDEPKGWMLALDRGTLGRVDALLTLSESLARDLHERLGAPREKITVIPNGIDTAAADRALAAARGGARGNLGLSPADFVVATMGRLHGEKGLPVLLEAFRPFLHEHPRGVLLLPGDGPLRNDLERQTAMLKLAGAVRFLGPVSSPWEVLAAADLFALPSLYEGMPNALLEAMAASLPVVATTVGAVPEMVTDGREGLLVPPGDAGALFSALDRLAWAGDLRREMGRRGRGRVEKEFRAESVSRRLDALYQELLGP